MKNGEDGRNLGVRAAWSIILFALFVLLLLSLISYDWRDISVLNKPPPEVPYNFIGPAGAWTAFVLFQVSGVGAYLFPMWFVVFCLLLIFKGTAHLKAKIGIAAGFMVSLACLLQLQDDLWAPLCRYINIDAPGGVVAKLVVTRILNPLWGGVGTGIAAVAGLLATAVLFLGWEAIVLGVAKFGFACEALFRRLATRRTAFSVPESVAAEERAGAGQRRGGRTADSKRPAESEERGERLRRGVKDGDEPSPRGAGGRRAQDSGQEEDEPREEHGRKVDTAPRQPDKKPPPPPKPALRRVYVKSKYILPAVDLLDQPHSVQECVTECDAEAISRLLTETLLEFGIEAEVKNAERGPVVTRYELLPAPGVRVERIASLSNNLALALKATSVRVQAPIPGKGLVGIEVPNSTTTLVALREIVTSQAWMNSSAELPLALGKDISGAEIISDLTAMPHLLVAGATGSGKTVCINSILAGLLISRTPETMRLILIDPKIVEFAMYNNLPHLVGPVITNPKKVALGLQWAIKEMERRYRVFAKAGVRNVRGYNARFADKQGELFPGIAGVEPQDDGPLPYIVIIVDELADLMLVAQAEIENAIARLAQLSRAVGIHMILATQRPSAKVITGTIKANFPARIAFQVPQMVDSRTILDANGAEKLLGCGDMLFVPPGASKLVRAQGTMTSDGELNRIIEFIKKQAPQPPPGEPGLETESATVTGPNSAAAGETAMGQPAAPEGPVDSFTSMLENGDENDAGEDTELIDQSIQIIRETHRASTSSLQRRLRIGYTRAARVMDVLEERGIVGPAHGSDPREILIDLDGEIPDNRRPSVEDADGGGR